MSYVAAQASRERTGSAEDGAVQAPCLVEGAPGASELQVHARTLHTLLESWLQEPGATLACGRWADGAISELVLDGRASLLPERYDGPFAGIREIRLAGSEHHLHVDLGRVERIAFAVAPCVCLGFRPSFEVRLLTRSKPQEWLVALMLSPPYIGDQLDLAATRGFFTRACGQMDTHPEITELTLDPALSSSPYGQALLEMLDAVAAETGACVRAAPPSLGLYIDADAPRCLPLLKEALALLDASLVIFRERTLVEFKTDYLDGVHRYEEQGHVSWQLGAFGHHHCHLTLDAVTRVLFSAEPVPCQGGGLNYTIWFLAAGSIGNPYRPDGYFSVTLNRPYRHNVPGAAPRLEVIEPVLDLYRRFRGASWIETDARFERVLAEGPPARPKLR